MNVNELAVNKRTALRMFWDAGHTTEQQLIAASNKLERMNHLKAIGMHRKFLKLLGKHKEE